MGLDHRVPPRPARLLPAAASVTGLAGAHLSWKSGEARSSASLRRCCRSFRRSVHPGMPCAARRALARFGRLARFRGDMTGRSAPPGARSVWSGPAPRRRARRRSTHTWWAWGWMPSIRSAGHVSVPCRQPVMGCICGTTVGALATNSGASNPGPAVPYARSCAGATPQPSSTPARTCAPAPALTPCPAPGASAAPPAARQAARRHVGAGARLVAGQEDVWQRLVAVHVQAHVNAHLRPRMRSASRVRRRLTRDGASCVTGR